MKTIPMAEMRDKGALGDYWIDEDGTLQFRASESGNPVYDKLVLVHEMVEELLTSAKGIKEQDIMAFDLTHPDSDEPGLEPDAPYRDAHLLSEAVERLILAQLGMSWKKYETHMESLWRKPQ